MSEASPVPRRQWWLWIIGSLLVVVILFATAGGWLWSSRPAWWGPPSGDDPVVQSNARKFENILINTAHQKAAGDWTVTITQQQVNQWLAVRLPPWLANQNHPLAQNPLPKIMIAFFPDRLELAFDATPLGHDQIFRLVYKPTIPQDGQTVQLMLSQVYGGRLPLPRDKALDLVSEHSSPEAAANLAQLDLAGRLTDGRNIRVIHVQMHEGKVILTCRTESE